MPQSQGKHSNQESTVPAQPGNRAFFLSYLELAEWKLPADSCSETGRIIKSLPGMESFAAPLTILKAQGNAVFLSVKGNC